MKNMRNKKSRVLALLLSLCMVMTLLPTMAFAADYDDTDGLMPALYTALATENSIPTTT